MPAKRGNILIPLVILLLLSALIATGYFYYQSKQPKNPLTWEDCLKQPNARIQTSYPGVCRLPDGRSVVQPLSDEEKKKLQPPNETVDTEAIRSANWKTYTDPINSYSIQYPADWNQLTKPYKDDEPLFSNKNSFQPTNTPDEIRFAVSVYYKDSSQCNAGNEYDCEWYFNFYSKMAPGEIYTGGRSPLTKVANLTIGGRPGIITQNQIGDNAFNLNYETRINDNYYFFGFHSNTKENLDKNRPLFDQILSTFKFLD